MIMSELYSLCYIYFSTPASEQKFLNKSVDNKYCGFFKGSLLFFAKFFYLLFKSPKSFRKLGIENCLLFFAESRNNQLALAPIIKSLDPSVTLSITSPLSYPSWKQYMYAIPQIVTLIQDYRHASENDKKTIRFFFAKVWRSYGCRPLASDIMDFYKPKLVVLANDHLPLNRAIMLEANSRNIPTMYVQHAAVTNRFPPLCYTYSFLDGLDSFEKYKSAGLVKGNIILSGGVRFDDICRYKSESERICIGVSLNSVDDTSRVQLLCLSLKEHYSQVGYKIILRPHPGLPQDNWQRWCNDNGIMFSDARKEPSFEYLSKLRVMVSNQSSIHLDAAMCHTPSVVYELASVPQNDFYSFMKEGLVSKCNTMNELFEFIDNSSSYSFNTEAIRFFNSSFHSEFEGQVSKLIKEIIETINSGLSIDDVTMKYSFKKEICDTYNLFSVQ